MNKPNPDLVPAALREAAAAGEHKRFMALTDALIAPSREVTSTELRRYPWLYLPLRTKDLINDQLETLRLEYGERPGPRSNTFRHFAELAAVYEAAARLGFSSSKQVAQWASVSKAAAEKQILRTRKLGFLPEPIAGYRQAWLDVEPEATAEELSERFVSWNQAMGDALDQCHVSKSKIREAAGLLSTLDVTPSEGHPMEMVEWVERINDVLHDRPLKT